MRRDAPYLTELPVGATSTDPARGAVPPAAHHLGDGRGPHLHRVRCATYGGLVCFPPKPQNFDKRRQQSEYRDAWRELLRRPGRSAWCRITEAEATGFQLDHMFGKGRRQ